jgi:hypothetical protein
MPRCLVRGKAAAMALAELHLPGDGVSLPGDVRALLREADRRIERFQRERGVPAFVPSDFAMVYAVLRALATAEIAPGNLFCEWGSGFGVVACLAAMLEFESWGIEIEGELVDAAQQLADDFGLPVEFIQGSFIPRGSDASLLEGAEFAWLTTDGDSPQEALALSPDDFDVIFAYPWPDEEWLIEALFARHAAVGEVLATYHGGEDLRLRRKVIRG